MNLRKTLKLAALFMTVIFIMLLVLFLKVDRLHPELKKLEEANNKIFQYDDANMFFDLLTFGREEGADLESISKQYVDLSSKQQKFYHEYEAMNLNSFEFSNVDKLWRRLIDNNSLLELQNSYSIIDSASQNYSVLDKRFKKIQAMNELHTPYSSHYTNETPIFFNINHYYRLRQIKHLSDYFHSNDKSVLTKIKADLDFCRLLLEKSDSLILKIIAMITINNTLSTIEFILDNSEPSKQLDELMDSITKFRPEEYQMRKVLENDLLSYTSKFDNTVSEFWKSKINIFRTIFKADIELTSSFSGPIVVEDIFRDFIKSKRLTFQEIHFFFTLSQNKLKNMIYDDVTELLNIADLSNNDLPAKFSQVVSDENHKNEDYKPEIADMFSFIAPMSRTFVVKIRELDGMIQLLKAKSMIYRNEIAKEEIDDYLGSVMSNANNPFSTEQLYFNMSASTIYYDNPFPDGYIEKYYVKLRR